MTRLKTGAVQPEEYWADEHFPTSYRPNLDPSAVEAAALAFTTALHEQLHGQGDVTLHAERLHGTMLAGTTQRSNGAHILLLGHQFEVLTPTDQAAALAHEALHMLHARYRAVVESELTLAGLPPRIRHRVTRAVLMEEERVLAVLEPFMSRALSATRRWQRTLAGHR